MVRHIPNAITASRGLAGVAVVLLLINGDANRLAFWVFTGALLTDLFDGALARRLGTSGELGRWLDPIADKMLTNLSWLALWGAGWAPTWLAVPMVLRDVAIGVAYTLARRRDGRFEVNHVGRVALSFEGIALAILLFHDPWMDLNWVGIGTAIGTIALGLSAWAVCDYLRTGPARQRSA